MEEKMGLGLKMDRVDLDGTRLERIEVRNLRGMTLAVTDLCIAPLTHGGNEIET